MYIYDMRPNMLPPPRWTTIKDYFHPGYNGLAIVEGFLNGLQHAGISQVFDHRFKKDLQRGKENRNFHWLQGNGSK